MKTVILTGKFGMGHYMAAVALKQQLEAAMPGTDTEMIDRTACSFPRLYRILYKLFNFAVTHLPALYNARYRRQENQSGEFLPPFPLCMILRFHRLLQDRQPDLIISTHPLCSQSACLYRRLTGRFIPLITCITDITGHSEWVDWDTDCYMAGSETVRQYLIHKGIPSGRITLSGIPVRSQFAECSPPVLSAGETYDAGSCNRPVRLLFMGGGLGMMPVSPGFYTNLSDRIHPPPDIVIITGNNHELYRILTENVDIKNYPNIRILGFVEHMAIQMRNADLLISKPGGITVFEAIHSTLPLAALNPTLQQELYISSFLSIMHIGTAVCGSGDDLISQLAALAQDRNKIAVYRSNLEALRHYYQRCDLKETVDKAICHARMSQAFYSRKDRKTYEKIGFNL